MRNVIFFSNAVVNTDKIEVIYEHEGKTTIQFPGGAFVTNQSIEDFWKEYKDNLTIDKDETEKDLARVTRDYEELAKECERKDERIKHLERMALLLLMDKSDRVYQELCEEARNGSE